MKKKVIIGLVAAIVVVVVFVWWRNQQLQQKEWTGIAKANGRIELERFDIATLRPGRVQSILIEEGDMVKADTVIARLSSDEIDAKLNEALAAKNLAESALHQAQKSRARAESALSRTKGTIAQAAAEIEGRKAQLAIAQNDLDNTMQLRQQKLVSAAELLRRQKARDAQLAAVNAATAALTQARAGKEEALAAIQEVDAGIEKARAAVQQAEARIAQAGSVREDLDITAPKAGRVEYKIAEVGNVLAAGSKVATLVDAGDVYMYVFLPTDLAGKVALNADARVVPDGLDVVFPARVTFVADEAQFTPKFVETANERAKMMYRVKVKLDPESVARYSGYLKGGMTAMGYVRYGTVTWPENLKIKATAFTEDN